MFSERLEFACEALSLLREGFNCDIECFLCGHGTIGLVLEDEIAVIPSDVDTFDAADLLNASSAESALECTLDDQFSALDL